MKRIGEESRAECIESPRAQTIAEQLIQLAEEVSCMAADLTDRAYNKLDSIVLPSEPCKEEKEERIFQEYPRLFDVLRTQLLQTRKKLIATDELLQRVDI